MWPRLEYLAPPVPQFPKPAALHAFTKIPLKGFYLHTSATQYWCDVEFNTTRIYREIYSSGLKGPHYSTFPPRRPHSGAYQCGVLVRLLAFRCPKCCVSTRNNTLSWHQGLVQSLPALEQLRLNTFQQANENLRKGALTPHKLVSDAGGLDLVASRAMWPWTSHCCALCRELLPGPLSVLESLPCQSVARCALGNAQPLNTAAVTCFCQIRLLGLGLVERREQGSRSVNSSEKRPSVTWALH